MALYLLGGALTALATIVTFLVDDNHHYRHTNHPWMGTPTTNKDQ
jgi:hypothetical protein